MRLLYIVIIVCFVYFIGTDAYVLPVLLLRSRSLLGSASDNESRRPFSNPRNIIYKDGIPDEMLNVKRVQKKPERLQGSKRKPGVNNPNLLHIVTGTARGRHLTSPDVYLRPMMEKVRGAMYNSLLQEGLFDSLFDGPLRVLDLFSGSGSIGLECLSRGADHCTFVDFSRDCVSTSVDNALLCRFREDQVNGVCAKAEDVLRQPDKFGLTQPYQLITMSPPYQEVVYSELIDCISNTPLIEPNTIVAIEYPIEMGPLPYVMGNFSLFGLRNKRYGRTVLATYAYKPTVVFDMRPGEFQRVW